MLNHNRPILGGQVLKFLDKQHVKNFEVILLDNCSEVSISRELIETLSYPVQVIKSSKKYHNELLNCAFHLTSGSIIFPFFADDDFLMPNATGVIEEIFTKNKDVEFLSLGSSKYDFQSNALTIEPENGVSYTGELLKNSAEVIGRGYFSNWYIGNPNNTITLNVCGHPSGTVVSKSLMQRTISRQGEIFLGPFGDVGLLGLLLYTQNHYKIDLPLVTIGTNHAQDSSLMRQYYGENVTVFDAKNRFSWDKFKDTLTYSPLKGITHVNLGTENHLQVLIRNGIKIRIPEDLRLEFFTNHLMEILKDNPWSERSENDFQEGVLQLQNALINNSVQNYQEIINNINHHKEETVKNKTSVMSKQSKDTNKTDYDFEQLETKLNNLMRYI